MRTGVIHVFGNLSEGVRMKIKLFVFVQQYDWEEQGKLLFWHVKVKEDSNNIFVEEIEVDVPDIQLPSMEQMARLKVTALQAERQDILSETHMKVAKIDEKISQLLALPNLQPADDGIPF